MPVYVPTLGPVQNAYVGYATYDLALLSPLTLIWPTSYQDSPNVVAANMTFTNSTDLPSPQITLPDATQVSVGYDFIITNLGTPTMFVNDGGNVRIDSIDNGIAKYYCLTNNSTSNGVWQITTFGAGSSNATAAALAGYGLNANAIGVTTGIELNTEIASNVLNNSIVMYNVLPTDYTSLIVWTSGGGSIYLPSTATSPVPTQVFAAYYVSINNAGDGTITVYSIDGVGIEGTDHITLLPSQTCTFISVGDPVNIDSVPTSWFTLGYGQSGGTGTVTSITASSSTGLNVVATPSPIVTTGTITVNLPTGTAGQVLSTDGNASPTLSFINRLTSGISGTLLSGQVTVTAPTVASNSIIQISRNIAGGTLGFLSVPTSGIVAGTGFIITSSSTTDTSTVNWSF